MKYHSIKETVTGAPVGSQHQNNTNPPNSPIDSNGVPLTSV